MRLPSILQRELDRAPGRWALEMGSRHLHIRVDGRLVAILCKDGMGSERSPRGIRNLRAQVRRAIEGRGA